MERPDDIIGEAIETGASEGDARGNSPDAPGFTDTDRLFRSHFQHANRPADLPPEKAELDLEPGWVNVRTDTGDWTSAPEVAKEALEQKRHLGYVDDAPPLSDARLGERPPYSDPVAENIDPTSPESPEQTFDWQRRQSER